MSLIVILFHVAACVALILIVLLQKGKGASMGAAFGGSSQTIFGSTGAAPFLSKLTAAAAIAFMITSLLLALMLGKGSSSSVMKGVGGRDVPAAQQGQGAPPPPAEQK
ncbi:MAG: preprotein translocase subunit SecG [Thermodesulfobacteriota bacterium]